VSARGGENIAGRSSAMPWYTGPTLLGALDGFEREAPPPDQPLRVVVQDVYRFDARRIIAGRVEAGTLRVGDRVRFYPGGEAQVVSRLEAWAEEPPSEVHAGQSVGFTLADQIFVERGMVAAHEGRPPRVANRFVASFFWMGREAMRVGAQYRLKLLTADVPCRVVAIRGSLDPVGGGDAADRLERHGAAEVVIETHEALAFDLHAELGVSGRFVIVAGYDVVGGGIVTAADDSDVGAAASWAVTEAVIAARDGEAALLAERLRARGDTVLCLSQGALQELARLAERAATSDPEAFRDRAMALGRFLGAHGVGLVAVSPEDEG
jgi:bifunctional enzyme CysN/CysC